jgi:hypothetical protein
MLSLSCSNGTVNDGNMPEENNAISEEGPVIIDLNNPELGEGILKLSDIGKGIDYIPLETNDNCLIRNINAIELSGSNIYVSTPGQLLLFDTTGSFIRRIGSEGNGPGEYNAIADIAVDSDDGSVYLISILGKKIMHFSIEGEFLDSFPLDFPVAADNIELYKGNIYLSFSDLLNSIDDESNKLMVAGFNRSGELVEEYGSELPLRDNIRVQILLPCEVLYTYNNALMVKEIRSDTLYRISGNGIIDPAYIFDYSESKMPLEEYSYESFAKRYLGNRYVYFLKVTEDQNNLFFTYKHKGEDIHWIFSKASQELYKYSPSESQAVIPDDIRSGPGFWPLFANEDDYLLGYLEPALLSEQELESLSGITGNTTVSSNPVIQIVRY